MILDFYKGPDLALNITSEKDNNGFVVAKLNGQAIESAEDYQPTEVEKLRTQEVMRKFWYARVVQQNPYAEFNDMSLLARLNHDQKVFNSWVPAVSDDPDLAWMSDAYRPIARNKVISITAHITRNPIFPEVVAIDKESEEQRDAAEVMRKLMQWVGEVSNYAKNFFYSILDALHLPATIIHHEYVKKYRTQKTINPDGTWKRELVLDELNSGFQDTLLGCDELFIADAFIPDIQKQPYLIWRRAIEYDVAYQKYHSDKYDEKGNCIPNNFDKYVRPGMQLLFDAQTVLFYRQYDENLRGNLVEEVKYYSRTEDLFLTFVNGVLISHPDSPNPRNDKLYPFVKGGYEPFNSRFFWYCSLIKKIFRDEEVVNTLYRMVIDGTYLKIFKPTFIFGEDRIDGTVIVPGASINLKKDTKVQPYDIGADIGTGLGMIEKVERSISESAATGEQNQGIVPGGNQTAREIVTVEENARFLLGFFARMISFMVKDWGTLIIGDIIQHLSVGEAETVLSTEEARLKFNTFLISEKFNGIDKKSRIVFNPAVDEIYGKTLKNHKGESLDFETLNKEGVKIEKGRLTSRDTKIFTVNPEKFRSLKYMVIMKPENLLPLPDSVERALNLELFDRLIKSGGDQEEALRLLLSSYPNTKDNPDKFLPKKEIGADMSQGLETQSRPQGVAKILANAVAMRKSTVGTPI